MLKDRFLAGETFGHLLERPKKYGELWDALYKRAKVSDDIAARAADIRHPWHLLVLSEDWCGDSINTLPAVARLTESVPLIDMRIIGRDANPDLMNSHLTGVSRSIPVIMVLDDDFNERGWWGPRPGPLQTWVMERGLALPKDERYREVRTWYARDHGETALNELLEIIAKAEATEERA
jgi:thioredoxin family protein